MTTIAPFPHHYAASVTGAASGHAPLSAPNVPTLSTATPAEFGGPGDAWSPELLLLGAVETCFLFTFRAVAHASKLAFDHVRVNCVGVVDRQDRVTRFTEIVLHVTIRVPEEADVALVERLAEKAERACLVTASLSTPVRLVTVVEAATPAYAGVVAG